MTHTSARVWQWTGIILILCLFGGAYWYFQVFAGVKTNALSPTGSLTSGLVGYWPFDRVSVIGTTSLDRSTSKYNGSLSGGPTVTSGQIGQAVDFDGSDDFMSLGSTSYLNVNATADMTISGWFFRDTFTTNDVIVAKIYGIGPGETGYGVYISSGDQLIFKIGDGVQTYTVTTSMTFTTSVWTHFSIVWDQDSAANTKIYINGQSVSTSTSGTISDIDDTSHTNTFRIGALSSGGELFDGKLDEIRVYNRTLTASEVLTLYNFDGTGVELNSGASQAQGGSRLDSGLAGYWKLDDGSGTSATDASTNGNTGTLTNGPTWTTGQIGGAVNFDGTDDYIDLGTTKTYIDDGKPFTAAIWLNADVFSGVSRPAYTFKTNGLKGWVSFLDSGASYEDFSFGRDTSSSKRISFPGGFTTGVWRHVVIVYNGNGFNTTSNYTAYVDGASVVVNSSSTLVSIENENYIGSYRSGGSRGYWDGKLDDLRFYNRQLSADEVSQLYRLTSPTGVDTSLDGYWSFNGKDVSGTTAYDRSGSGNNGTLTNGPTITEGKVGQGIAFSSAGTQVVTVPYAASLNPTSTMSLSAWIKTGSAANNKYILNRDATTTSGYGFFLGAAGNPCTTTGVIGFTIGATTNELCSAGPNLGDSLWHHVVAVYDGTTASLYVDGTLNTSGSLTNSLNNATSPLWIGTNSTGNRGFDGSIDEVRIYNTVLTAAQIQSLYKAGESDTMNVMDRNGNLNNGLAGYWKLDEGSGTSAVDSSINGSTGTLTNGPTWGAGQVGGAATFDGVNDYVTAGTASALNFTTNTFAISAWIYPTAIPAQNQAVYHDSIFERWDHGCTGHGYAFRLTNAYTFNAPTELELNVNCGSATGTTLAHGAAGVLVNNQWQHVVAVINAGVVTFYINGTPYAATGNITENPTTYGGPATIGSDSTGTGNPFTGSIDEVRVYSRAITANEVAQLYRYTAPAAADSGLAGYWSFNGTDMTSTKAYDRSGAGNTGTLTNGPTVTEGRLGQGLLFDGVDDYVTGNITNVPMGNTMAVWFKIDNVTGNKVIFSHDDNTNSGQRLQLSGSTFQFTLGGVADYSCGFSAATANTWYFFAAATTGNGGTVTCYLGQENGGFTAGSPSAIGTRGGTPTKFNIGRLPSTGTPFGGKIDEARLYNRVLTEAEIKSLYNTSR